MRPERRTSRALLATAQAQAERNPSLEARALVDQRRADYRALKLEDAIREVVEGWPPIDAATRDRLAVLLRGGDAA